MIIGGDADLNVGDTAILHSLCSALVSASPSVRITITSTVPGHHGLALPPGVVAVVPKGFRHWVAQLQAARQQDLLIVGGGGLFQDDDSRVKMPYWATRLAALQLACPHIVGHCLGAGPLQHVESRAFARLACASLQQVSVRDQFALDALQPCTAKRVKVVPDPAFMLAPASPSAAIAHLDALGIARERPLIGVALRRWFHRLGGFVPHRVRSALGVGRNAGQEQMQALVGDLSQALARLATRLGADVLLLPSYHASHEGDVDACRTLGRGLAAQLPGDRVHLAEIRDPALYKAIAGRLQLLVSARMHPLILAAGMGVPVLGLGYNGKFAGCMDLLGIPGQLLWLRDLGGAGQSESLETRAMEALNGPADLARRAGFLGEQSQMATAQLLQLVR